MSNPFFIRLVAFVPLFLSAATVSLPRLMAAPAAGATQSKPDTRLDSQDASGAALVGRRWRLTEVRGTAVKTTKAYVVFNGDTKRYGGHGGCNMFSGEFEISAMNLKLSPAVHTAIRCLDKEAQQVEDDLLTGLAQSTRFQIHDDVLRLFASGSPILTFELEATVTGTVTYWRPVALPQEAVVEVKLLDVSQTDAPAIVSEQTIRPVGQPVSIAFVLPYDPHRIGSGHRYVVQARILEEDGELRFSNTEEYPVITGGHPDSVNVIVKPAGR